MRNGGAGVVIAIGIADGIEGLADLFELFAAGGLFSGLFEQKRIASKFTRDTTGRGPFKVVRCDSIVSQIRRYCQERMENLAYGSKVQFGIKRKGNIHERGCSRVARYEIVVEFFQMSRFDFIGFHLTNPDLALNDFLVIHVGNSSNFKNGL